MEYSEENACDRPSGIRPPMIRIPSPGKGLQEITPSENNTRAKPVSRMAAPNNIKRAMGYHDGQPEPKQRKTLAERGGEPVSKPTIPTISGKPPVKGTSLVSASSGVSSIFLSDEFLVRPRRHDVGLPSTGRIDKLPRVDCKRHYWLVLHNAPLRTLRRNSNKQMLQCCAMRLKFVHACHT
ncbi:hypothetical protein GLAREA_09773 [Glarea lozoyensis ATCC 20868]|uniref:Uncharacterized protein n=1 Tax=Glarea lozoyensis (strain ATCC 20868 / MF5171) TaxID=1116229 RepID=S3CQ98_GLAL2|nr:uncharacterized protein GLAREA_09773 [Glarea lozoyensis ATCC 20868]EPE28652.1 hypothetical protein GLAREA_09773 [Glarea lozoyensis ATCC 20868]